jgi:steroid delta-isomerase
MTPDTIDTAIANYITAINALNAKAFAAAFTEDGISHDPVGAPVLVGHEALKQFFANISVGFESVAFKIDETFHVATGAAIRWSASGVGKNGRSVSFSGIDAIEVSSEGRIQTLRAYWDPAKMMAELMG